MLWRLLYSEWSYRRGWMAAVFLAEGMTAALALAVLPAPAQTPMLVLLSLLVVYFAGLSSERARISAHTSRRDHLLPMGIRSVALGRLLFPLSTWIAGALVLVSVQGFWRLLGQSPEGFLRPPHWVSLNGVVCIVVGAGQCFGNLRGWVAASLPRRLLWVVWKVVAGVSVLPFVFMTNAALYPTSQELPAWDVMGVLEATGGMVGLNLAGAALLLAGYGLYLIRPDYSNP